MSYILIALLAFVLGLLLFPALAFLRARRGDNVDPSFFGILYFVFAYCVVHLGELKDLAYPNGVKPFHYADKNKDLFKDILGIFRN